MHRRECLGQFGRVIVGLGAARVLRSAAARRTRIGAHPWVYAARQPQRDPTPILDQIFQELGAAGMDFIELMPQPLLQEGSVSRIRELSKRFHLPVIGTSWSGNMWNRDQHPAILKESQTLIPRVAKTGGCILGTSVGDARRTKTPAELDAQADVLRRVMKICSDNGVVLNLHNHTYEVADREYDLNGTLERVPEVKLGPDIGWLVRAKVDPVDFIRRHRGRIVYAHLRDDKADGTWPEAMGEGVLDYAAVGRALHEIGFSGDMAIELAHERQFEPTRTYGESFRISREYVRRVMNYPGVK